MIIFFLSIFVFTTVISALLYFYDKKKFNLKEPMYYMGVFYIFFGLPLIFSFYAIIGMISVLIGTIFLFFQRTRISSLLKIFGFLPIIGVFVFLFYWEIVTNYL